MFVARFYVLIYFTILVPHLAIASDIICPEDPGPGQYLFPHPNCSLFYVCEGQTLTILNCPGELYFNPTLKVCDFPENVPECQQGTRPPNPSTGEPATTTTPGNPNPTTVSPSDWIVIQRRGAPLEKGEAREQFNRSWAEYEDGFGDPDKDFWLGLREIARITDEHGDHELNILMKKFSGETLSVNYEAFWVNANDEYRLHVSGFSGNAPDALTSIHNGMTFSTQDHGETTACAAHHRGGWWFKNCFTSFLNGPYYDDVTPACSAIRWESPPDACQGSFENLAFTEMKVRRNKHK